MPPAPGRSFGAPAGAQRQRVPGGEPEQRNERALPEERSEGYGACDGDAPPQPEQEAQGFPELIRRAAEALSLGDSASAAEQVCGTELSTSLAASLFKINCDLLEISSIQPDIHLPCHR